MIRKIYTSFYSKPLALLLAVSILCMSFKSSSNGDVVLNAGTSVVLETISMIRSDGVTAGQIIDFRVKFDVKADNVVVIRAGTIAKGQVMRAQKAKGLGKEGFLEIQIRSVTAVDGQEVFLSGGTIYQEGEDKQILAIILGIGVCPLLLTIKGKNAEIPAGYQINAGVATGITIKI